MDFPTDTIEDMNILSTRRANTMSYSQLFQPRPSPFRANILKSTSNKLVPFIPPQAWDRHKAVKNVSNQLRRDKPGTNTKVKVGFHDIELRGRERGDAKWKSHDFSEVPDIPSWILSIASMIIKNSSKYDKFNTTTTSSPPHRPSSSSKRKHPTSPTTPPSTTPTAPISHRTWNYWQGTQVLLLLHLDLHMERNRSTRD